MLVVRIMFVLVCESFSIVRTEEAARSGDRRRTLDQLRQMDVAGVVFDRFRSGQEGVGFEGDFLGGGAVHADEDRGAGIEAGIGYGYALVSFQADGGELCA